MIQVYDTHQTYEWNYQHGPDSPPHVDIPPVEGNWDFCGIPVNSPLGVPAGPLLNSRWILHYAALGFDVLTYKTVRSAFRPCFDLPNLLPVEDDAVPDERRTLQASNASEVHSWAISFGMPSRDPEEWRKDVERARNGLAKDQVLVVSVVASPAQGWSIEDVARDFAQCARWAADSGAHVVEPNLSCPNVCTQEADLYLSPEASGIIAQAVRQAVPELPIALKVGLFPDSTLASAVVNAVSPYANGICATNSISAKVASNGELLFDGKRRGIGGAAINARCLEETELLHRIMPPGMQLVSVGGVSNADDVRARLRAGAHHVQIATAAMIDPMIAIRIRKEGVQ